MWPGQQQPGGGQNPQDPNPYQQPGYQQPNPYQQPGQQPPGYQQPGFQQPNPYQQPGQQGHPQPGPGPWGAPGAPGPPGGGRKNARRNTVIAIAVSVAVVAAAVVTGVVLLGDDPDGASPAGGGAPSASASAPQDPKEAAADPSEEPGGHRDPDSPRGSGEDEPGPEPVVDGWQVVVNPKHHSAFDVPKGWELASQDTIVGWGEKQDEDAMFATPQVAMSAPAFLEEGWCEDSDGGTYSRATVGTKGAQGAKNTSEAALSAAQNFVFYRHDEDRDKLTWTEAEPFTSDHGIKGHVATAAMTGVEKANKCVADGKAVAVSWLDASRDLRLWVLISDAGVPDEVDQKTIDTMMKSLRPYGEEE
ncbi:hypothetical protein V1J52_21385 [Streptomyces sp. TRM 70351]|uniref:hypothetical protein n=1 Tax=Streptomyces sp. TRM 70351 TaxID=3116552 RepID=UPI002E7B054F|nr:hypothetical protein [Streptomyces sp. TRM 70351]MEE1930710.1 hypothetical protein [Streptomyces sp. TRM 70351]